MLRGEREGVRRDVRRRAGLATAAGIAASMILLGAAVARAQVSPATAAPDPPPDAPPVVVAPEATLAPGPNPAARAIYRMSPGDQIEISYYRRYDRDSQAYALDVGDVITLQVEDHPELSAETVVRPDGMISAPLLGDVPAGGITPEALRAALKSGYATRIPQPVVTIFVKGAQAKLNEFFLTLMSGDDGATRTLVVRPDGRVSLPLLGEVTMAGHTVEEMQVEISNRYRDIFRYMEVSINVTSSYERRVTVLGEVARPGMFPLSGSLTIPQALALAGGLLESAQPKNVYVVRRNPDDSYIGLRVNLQPREPQEGMGAGIELLPRDIVVVPKSGIAKVDKWVDQYIRKVLPFNIGAGVFYTIDSAN